MKKVLSLILSAATLCACSRYDKSEPGSFADSGKEYSDGGSSSGTDEQGKAGVVTAGEWRDLDNWLFWSGLMADSSDYASNSDYWEFYTNNRVAVRVTGNGSEPQRDIPVQLVRLAQGSDEPTVLYEARTDNKGETNLWIGLTQKQQSIEPATLRLMVDGIEQEQPVAVTQWDEEVKWNTCTAFGTFSSHIDIAFIVDATGSMTDEINFLKADLTNIIRTVSAKNTTYDIRTAAVFYRDEGDDYLTRESDFTSDLSVTTSFIGKQSADGGGDYPEAVHTALETGLQKLSWREDDCIRLAFMLLDAPPHKNANVIASLHKSIPLYAKAGIRIIPVAASGVDKSTEFFLRFTAMATDGTYVFITNDSGVGNDHIAATVGKYEVEQLNELIARLIYQYME